MVAVLATARALPSTKLCHRLSPDLITIAPDLGSIEIGGTRKRPVPPIACTVGEVLPIVGRAHKDGAAREVLGGLAVGWSELVDPLRKEQLLGTVLGALERLQLTQLADPVSRGKLL